ncbi:MAG: hypothetical protein ACR2GQ_03210 [Gemmatimonadota bacterium]
MANQPVYLRPHDVCVALQLVIVPGADFRSLARQVGVSLGEAHNSVGRLQSAHLVLPHRREANRRSLLEFVMYGVPYSFPGELGAETLGVPTAHSGPAFRDRIAAADIIVWPSSRGKERGVSLVPLCPAAPDMINENPQLYRWLTAVDVLRVGRARERKLAREILEPELRASSADLFDAAGS